jgi:hypothetical protein
LTESDLTGRLLELHGISCTGRDGCTVRDEASSFCDSRVLMARAWVRIFFPGFDGSDALELPRELRESRGWK